MRTRTYPKASRAALLDELVARLGIDPRLLDVATGDDGTIVRFPDDIDPAVVDSVVAAHDAAALDAAARALADQDTGDLGKVRAAYQTLRSNADALRADAAAMPATLTAAQVRARLIQIEGALADVSDFTASLARYVGRRLG